MPWIFGNLDQLIVPRQAGFRAPPTYWSRSPMFVCARQPRRSRGTKRVFFEVVERRGYDGNGAANAAIRLSAQARHRDPPGV